MSMSRFAGLSLSLLAAMACNVTATDGDATHDVNSAAAGGAFEDPAPSGERAPQNAPSGTPPAGRPVGAPNGALPAAALDPADNASSPAKVSLGRQLFWDPILSGDRDVACVSCHQPALAYGDGRKQSVGAGGRLTTRSAMTLLDVAFNGLPGPPANAPMFWDSRVSSLENQARGPITTLGEMRGTSFDETTIFPELTSRLEAIPEYVTSFEAAFGAGAITEESIVRAIAAFERTLVDHDSSYDRFVKGDASALTAAQQRGMNVFNQGGCTACHSGPMFSDYKLHRLGVPDLPGAAHDVGAGGGAFRTASLRNVARTGPYMHDGVFGSLDQVFGFYARIDRRLDPALANLRAPRPDEAADVKAFLGALSDGAFDATAPESVPSGLTPGGSR